MSDKVGNVVFDSGHDEVFIGRSMAQTKNYSEEVAALIDQEIKGLIDGAYNRCVEILSARRKELDFVADYLLKYENMDGRRLRAGVHRSRCRPAPRRLSGD